MSSKGAGRSLRVILIALALCVVVGLGLILTLINQIEDTTYNMTDNWPTFYEEVVSSYFKIPSAAVVKEAVYTDAAIMGMRFSVRFSLPKDKSPDEWLTIIASQSGFKPGYRRGPHDFSCGSDCDLLRLQYLPEQNLYIAEAGWD